MEFSLYLISGLCFQSQSGKSWKRGMTVLAFESDDLNQKVFTVPPCSLQGYGQGALISRCRDIMRVSYSYSNQLEFTCQYTSFPLTVGVDFKLR